MRGLPSNYRMALVRHQRAVKARVDDVPFPVLAGFSCGVLLAGKRREEREEVAEGPIQQITLKLGKVICRFTLRNRNL